MNPARILSARVAVAEGLFDVAEALAAVAAERAAEAAALRVESEKWCPARPWSDAFMVWQRSERIARRILTGCMVGKEGFWSCEDCGCADCAAACDDYEDWFFRSCNPDDDE